MAAAGRGPVVALLGDLAFLHDVSALVRPARPGPPAPATLVVVDNGGGGIFDFLPQAAALDPARFEQLFGTPQSPDVAEVAAGFGLAVADVGTPAELEAALEAAAARRPLGRRVRVPDRRGNVALHERIHAAVAAAVGGDRGRVAAPRAGGPRSPRRPSGSGRPAPSCRGSRRGPGPAGG